MDSAMKTMRRQTLSHWLVRAAFAAAVGAGLSGCGMQNKPAPPMVKYTPLKPDAHLPVYLRGSIRDLTQVGNVGNFPVSGWGLVVGLRGTGDTTSPSLVHEWMIKQMQVHMGISSKLHPDQMLNDPNVALVGVIANLPPGARRGDYIDVAVQAMPGNNTMSLANGVLYRSELKINGITDPVGAVNSYAKAQGNIFVNPVYAANAGDVSDSNPGAHASLRVGTIPMGALVETDRPIHLVLRTPSWATSRSIELRINQHFQKMEHTVAAAQDEGYLHIMVPREYHGNWQHFVGVVTHLFMNGDPAFAITKAKQLAEEAVKPNASLEDISFAWEGLGVTAIPFITPLMTHPQQDVQFAAARAAAFLGDAYGADRLMQIAATRGHAFQINAVQALGELPSSEALDGNLAKLLDSDQASVRLAAYEVLSSHDSPHIVSTVIHSKQNPENEFVLDQINCSGPPLIYCTRIGRPRVAIFGQHVSMQTPVVFSAFDSKLTITNEPRQPRILNVFYRDETRHTPVQGNSSPEVAALVRQLGGYYDEQFHFAYGDIVAILQAMADQKSVSASFVLQQLPGQLTPGPLTPNGSDSRPQIDAAADSRNSLIGASLPDLRPLPTTAPSTPGVPTASGPVSGRPQ